MSKSILFKLLLGLAFVLAAVMWLLSVLVPETFGFFNLSWAIAFLSGVGGVAFVLKGIFGKNVGLLKKLSIYVGAALIVVAFLCIVFALALPKNIVLPIIAVIVTLALLIGMLVVGGKKWDTGDNKKVGYKNYYERKKDEEDAKKDNEDK